jgi:hypothetical protein
LSSSRARRNRCIFRRYAELSSVRLLKDELEACSHEQVLDERAGSPVWWQATRARRALSDAAEPHLWRQERTFPDHRSVPLGCGSSLLAGEIAQRNPI